MMGKERLLAVGGVCVLVGLAYVAGKRTDGERTAHAETQAPVTTAAAPASSPPPATKERSPFDTSALDGLGAKLAAEKAMAGKSDPNASRVFAAIQDKLKISLGDGMQPLAGPLGAQYCERMTTKHDVYVVVCEFANEESARVGQKKATNDVVKRREVLQRRASTCAVHQVGETTEAQEEAKRIKALFLAL
jgi:hypothetical protein